VNELALVSRFLLATVFTLAGAAKLARRSEFTEAVRNYRLLPAWANELVGRGLPPLELLLGVLLFSGLEAIAVAALASLCLLSFTVAVTVNLLQGRRVECGCFGLVADSHLGWSLVGRNALLLLAGLVVASHPVTEPLSAEVAWLIVASVATLAGGLFHEALRLQHLAKTIRAGSL
jgi:Methylamine utilisation protein MauE